MHTSKKQRRLRIHFFCLWNICGKVLLSSIQGMTEHNYEQLGNLNCKRNQLDGWVSVCSVARQSVSSVLQDFSLPAPRCRLKPRSDPQMMHRCFVLHEMIKMEQETALNVAQRFLEHLTAKVYVFFIANLILTTQASKCSRVLLLKKVIPRQYYFR